MHHLYEEIRQLIRLFCPNLHSYSSSLVCTALRGKTKVHIEMETNFKVRGTLHAQSLVALLEI